MPKFAFLVNNDGYRKYTYEAAKAAGASVPHINRWMNLFKIHNAEPLNRYFEFPLKSIWYRKVVDDSKFQTTDEVFFILYESFHMSYSRKLIKHYKKKYKNSKFIYLFTNPVNDYNLKRLSKIEDSLDAIFSFNKADADKYGYYFLETDLFLLPEQNNYELKTDVFFIGAEKGRLPLLLNIYRRLTDEGFICDFWITDVPAIKQEYTDAIHYNQRLSYDEVLKRVAQTHCIVEVLQDGKTYSSIRTLEAVQYHKKLLTTNSTVIDRWFYNPEIMQVFNCSNDINIDFIRKPVDYEIYKKINLGTFAAFKELIIKTMSTKQENKTIKDLYNGGLIEVIRSDLSRLCKPTFVNAIKLYLLPRGTVFRFDVWFRILQWSRLTKSKKLLISPIVYLIQRHYEYKYGIHANANIYIGKGLHIVHGDGVHLNCDYIGENFTVFQGTTLGAKHGGRPRVLDNVTVYTNSVVCGDITLNNGCSVGAQSYVDKDVEAGAFVAGVPAKKIISAQ